MNKSKVFTILIGIFLLGLSFVGCDKAQITLPNESDLKSIVLSESTKENNIYSTITSKKEIKSIIDSIKLDSKQTSIESVNDVPTNIDDYIKLEFLHSKEGSSIAYLYKTKNRYYIEQPYIGIWEITKESYDLCHEIG